MKSKLEKLQKLLAQDKRRAERLPLKLTVFYSLTPLTPPTHSSQQWIGPLKLIDIGGGGLKFESKERLKKNTYLNLSITLPHDPHPIIFVAEVSWCKKVATPVTSKTKKEKILYHIGLKFHKMNYTDRKKIISYICENILSYYLNKNSALK